MAVVLQAEGFNVTERELMRLRSKHRLLLRGANARSDDQPVPQAAVPDSMSSASPSMGPTHDMVNDGKLVAFEAFVSMRWFVCSRRETSRIAMAD